MNLYLPAPHPHRRSHPALCFCSTWLPVPVLPGKPDSDGAYDMGGVATNPKKENGENQVKRSNQLKDIHW